MILDLMARSSAVFLILPSRFENQVLSLWLVVFIENPTYVTHLVAETLLLRLLVIFFYKNYGKIVVDITAEDRFGIT